MIVLGFSGPARVGKSSITEPLKKVALVNGWKPHVLSFATPIKEQADAMGLSKTSDPEKYRAFCQSLGAKARKKDPDYWIGFWLESFNELVQEENESSSPYIVFVDDCRYENELEKIRSLGGRVYFIHPGERELIEAGAPWRTHESEALANHTIGDWPKFKDLYDGIIYNDSNLSKLDLWAHSFFELVINHPGDWSDLCRCEVCSSLIENRDADRDVIEAQLEEVLENFERLLNDEAKRQQEEGELDEETDDGNS